MSVSVIARRTVGLSTVNYHMIFGSTRQLGVNYLCGKSLLSQRFSAQTIIPSNDKKIINIAKIQPFEKHPPLVCNG